eukprot:763986-Hanusia_phi.AAC.3
MDDLSSRGQQEGAITSDHEQRTVGREGYGNNGGRLGKSFSEEPGWGSDSQLRLFEGEVLEDKDESAEQFITVSPAVSSIKLTVYDDIHLCSDMSDSEIARLKYSICLMKFGILQ